MTQTQAPTQPVDDSRLEEFLEKVLVEVGGAYNTVLTAIGDELGLYQALHGSGPLTSAELAARTGTAERPVREWLAAQAASGFLTYHPDGDAYELPPEQAQVLAEDTSPAYLAGLFQAARAVFEVGPRLADSFRTGEGIGWHEHRPGLFEGVERFFRSEYRANLVDSWVPAVGGLEAKLRAGARVADIGCGHGSSTILMAEAYPKSTFVGYDYHEASVLTARERATAAGVADRAHFEVALADSFPGTYGAVACFDCLHDMGDPLGAARHIRESLAPGGVWMIVEPFAGDRVEDNLNPVGRSFYSVSTLVCTQASLAQEGQAALGAQAGFARLEKVLRAAGFTQVRLAADTPFNLVIEARA